MSAFARRGLVLCHITVMHSRPPSVLLCVSSGGSLAETACNQLAETTHHPYLFVHNYLHLLSAPITVVCTMHGAMHTPML
jgi:hypothetical protein